jgi:diaminopimelate decarboxylase
MKQKPTPFCIQGIRVDDLERKFGTPLYVYDGNKIVTQLEKLRQAFDVNINIKFAVKALSNLSILRLLKKYGAGADVVSIQEARLALLAGFNANDIMFTPNNVDFAEIQEAVNLGTEITLDNLSSLEKFGQAYGFSKPVALRLNPHIMAGGNLKISTGHKNSKFGISVQQLPEILTVVDKYNMQISGLHIHTGSEIKDVGVFMQMAEILFGLAEQFPHLKFLDFGGGYKVAYKKSDQVTDIAALGKSLSQALRNYNLRSGREIVLRLEPGKFLVSEAGYLITKATVVKETPSVTFVGVNSGLNHLIRPMMYDAYHEIINGSNTEGPMLTYTIAGNICETDNLGVDRHLSKVQEGDLIIILNAGAYGFTMASNYNSRFKPCEVLILNGNAYLIRSRDTFEDLTKNQILLDM